VRDAGAQACWDVRPGFRVRRAYLVRGLCWFWSHPRRQGSVVLAVGPAGPVWAWYPDSAVMV